MRLLHTTTLDLHEFQGAPPPYAILSHTWGEEEVLFQDIGTPTSETKKGYGKIVKFCAQAKGASLDYAWVDTCCIDKRSSAELSEAINSMFRWYSKAHVCYAFLEDVDLRHNSGMRGSRWFTRGWTLQELLAPLHVVFFDQNWMEIGSKVGLLDELNAITGVPQSALACPATIHQYCVAERMFWAHQRETTRVEDIAYCLLGIFDVNMPLLYGEGKKAFRRLQLQIVSESGDHSIFAWNSPERRIVQRANPCDMLAESPACFTLRSIVQGPHKNNTRFQSMPKPEDVTITVSNVGLSMRLAIATLPHPPIRISKLKSVSKSLIAVLNCRREDRHIGIHVLHSTAYAGAWSRCQGREIVFLGDAMVRNLQSDLVIMTLGEPKASLLPYHRAVLQPMLDRDRLVHFADFTIAMSSSTSESICDNHTSLPPMVVVATHGSALMFTKTQKTAFILVFGMDHGRIWCAGFSCAVPSSLLEFAQSIWIKYHVGRETLPWRYYQDRQTHESDELNHLHVTIKPELVPTEHAGLISQYYRVDIC
ncbi:hypothetical protein PV08_02822 [Exophiala spinifera]|uniref:Heterokaryon incompatibility domain-containing protein n=1 Tax=Exophiala spinifera TaxID=91928 RepID=A0A0D2C4N8_9EURO|nr:uncharacterized protein PV08_02822 [Exophiala spinifera]KIW18534.1 hypothetical protein PV08_02822 [Exophiala spinifera]